VNANWLNLLLYSIALRTLSLRSINGLLNYVLCIIKLFSAERVIKFCYHFSERRQTMLFSATQTRKLEDLARVSLKKEPLYVGVDDSKDIATVEGLEQVHIKSKQSLRLVVGFMFHFTSDTTIKYGQ